MKKKIEEIRVRILNIVEKDKMIGNEKERLGKKKKILIEEIEGRRKDKEDKGMILNELRNIDKKNWGIIMEKERGERIGELSIEEESGEEEDEREDGKVRVMKKGKGKEKRIGYGMKRIEMEEEEIEDIVLNEKKILEIKLKNKVKRNEGKERNEMRKMVRSKGLLKEGKIVLMNLRIRKLILKLRDSEIGKIERFMKIKIEMRNGKWIEWILKMKIEIGRKKKIMILRMKIGGKLGWLLIKIDKLILNEMKEVIGRGVSLKIKWLEIDIEMNDEKIDIVKLLRIGIEMNKKERWRIIKKVDGIVRKEKVGDIEVWENWRRKKRGVRKEKIMVMIVFIIKEKKNGDCVIKCWIIEKKGMEKERKGGVIIKIFEILIKSGGEEEMKLKERKRRIKKVRRINWEISIEREEKCVNLVDEEDDMKGRSMKLREKGIKELIELEEIFGERNKRENVERNKLIVIKRLGKVEIEDEKRKKLRDWGIEKERIKDKKRIVIGEEWKKMDSEEDLIIEEDERIKIEREWVLSKIERIFIKRIIIDLGWGGIGGEEFENIVDKNVKWSRGEERRRKYIGGFGGFLNRKRSKEEIEGEEDVKRIDGKLIGKREKIGKRMRKIEMVIEKRKFRKFLKRDLKENEKIEKK